MTGFNWELDPDSLFRQLEGALSFGAFGKSASVATQTPHLRLQTLHLSPGNYLLKVQAIQGLAQSPWVSARITLLASDLALGRVRPNPFRSARGDTAIIFDQLAANSTVKILTVSGRVLKTLKATNGQVSWDLTNATGENVASGLYFFLVTDELNSKTHGQFAIIR